MPIFQQELIKILIYCLLSFLIAYAWAPHLINLLTWLRFWKKKSRNLDASGAELVVTAQFYKHEKDVHTPRAGGLLIWVTAVGFALFFWLLFKIEETNTTLQFLNFIDRRVTWIPIATLVFSSILGFIDDTMVTMEAGGNYHAGGLQLRQRVIIIAVISFFAGLWFHFRLTDKLTGLNFLHKVTLPFYNNGSWFKFDLQWISPAFTVPFLNLLIPAGWALIPLTVIVVLSCWGGSVIDGFDGLAAGCFIPMYLAFAGMALYDSQFKMATLLMVIVGAMVAYLLFNIAPAKFYMGDTGSTSLLVTIAIVAILLNKIWLLPLAGVMMYVTMMSNVIQIFSKKVFKRKVFLAAPIHHHFEAKGTPRQTIVYRYWLVSIACSLLALVLGIIIR
jgi:phospho-N-acetylmuramoyl-pentapeptide-transferase